LPEEGLTVDVIQLEIEQEEQALVVIHKQAGWTGSATGEISARARAAAAAA
jgi:hypothetical protein